MKSLPKKPNLEYLRKEAKTFRKLHAARNLQICARISQFDKSYIGKSNQEIFDSEFTAMDSQRIIAREYGYRSWAQLKHYVESLTTRIYHGVNDKPAYHRVITRSYDERSENYGKSMWHRDLASRLVDYAPPVRGQRVLDVATGTGTIAFYLSELVGASGSVVGVDISQGMLAACEQRLRLSDGSNIRFYLEDAEDIPSHLGMFDRIYCASAFYWMSHPLAALRHWYECLNSFGFLAFHAWPENSEIWGNTSRNVLKKYGIHFTVHEATGTEKKCRDLMALAGYENVQVILVEDGHFLSVEHAKGGLLTESHYAPGQYPHPMSNVPDDIIEKAQADYDAVMEKLNTDEGVWHDMNMFYVIGQKITQH